MIIYPTLKVNSQSNKNKIKANEGINLKKLEPLKSLESKIINQTK
jgi:hypothetical protein